MENDKLVLKAPKDKSVKAYKEWILALKFAMTGKKSDGSSISETEWATLCNEFWKGAGLDD